MKIKHLTIIPALLIAVLCMATTCKGEPKPDVDYYVYLTNNSKSVIDCKYAEGNNQVINSQQNKFLTLVSFYAKDPKEISVNFKLSNSSAGQFIDTTLTFKHIVLESLVMKVEMTLNEDLSLTVVEKQ